MSQRPQFLHGTNIDLGCMCQDRTTSTVDWHHLLTLPPHAALRPNPVYSTSVRHEPAETAGRKQLIPQCSAGLRSGLHNLSQTVEPIHPTPFGANGAGLEGGLWSQTVEVTAGGGTSQATSLCIDIVSTDEEVREAPPLSFTCGAAAATTVRTH